MKILRVTTSAFPVGGDIPVRFTCDGNDLSPPVSWDGVPEGTRSIALIVDDPDAPGGTFTHWVIYNIPAARTGIGEGVPKKPSLEDGTHQGMNSFGRTGYNGPCPPRGKPHRYFFKTYCIDSLLTIPQPARKNTLLAAMEGHILAAGEVMGKYSRK